MKGQNSCRVVFYSTELAHVVLPIYEGVKICALHRQRGSLEIHILVNCIFTFHLGRCACFMHGQLAAQSHESPMVVRHAPVEETREGNAALIEIRAYLLLARQTFYM